MSTVEEGSKFKQFLKSDEHQKGNAETDGDKEVDKKGQRASTSGNGAGKLGASLTFQQHGTTS